MAKKQKVLYLITKSNWGGAQRYVFDLATQMPFDAAVALGGEGELKQKLDQAGVKTISIPRLGRDIKIWDEILVFWEIFKIIRRENPDIVHLNSPKAGGLGALTARLAGIPNIIYTAHGWSFAEDRPAWQRLAIKFFSWLTILFCHQVIVISQSEYKKVENWPFARSKLHLIYNGASEPTFLPRGEARAALGLDQNEFIVGTIAELHKNKGLNYLTEKVVVIGEGEERKSLEGGALILLGRRENAAQYLKAFDVFILPSIKEGLPYVILEAGLACLPVIATKVGGIPEIIDHEKTGILVEPKNSPALTTAIQDLKNDPEKRATLGQNLRTTIQKRFSPAAMLNQTLLLYNK